jgi:hypothetical protein
MHNTQYKTVGVQWFASISYRINFSNGGYERTPKTQPFHIVKRSNIDSPEDLHLCRVTKSPD